MSLSECQWCGGHIPLGPRASNCCVDCGKYVMTAPPKPAQPTEADRLLRELVEAFESWYDSEPDNNHDETERHGQALARARAYLGRGGR